MINIIIMCLHKYINDTTGNYKQTTKCCNNCLKPERGCTLTWNLLSTRVSLSIAYLKQVITKVVRSETEMMTRITEPDFKLIWLVLIIILFMYEFQLRVTQIILTCRGFTDGQSDDSSELLLRTLLTHLIVRHYRYPVIHRLM